MKTFTTVLTLWNVAVMVAGLVTGQWWVTCLGSAGASWCMVLGETGGSDEED